MDGAHQEKELATCRHLEQELRRHGIIFQQELREQLALERGLPPEMYLVLSYEEWIEVRDDA